MYFGVFACVVLMHIFAYLEVHFLFNKGPFLWACIVSPTAEGCRKCTFHSVWSSLLTESA